MSRLQRCKCNPCPDGHIKHKPPHPHLSGDCSGRSGIGNLGRYVPPAPPLPAGLIKNDCFGYTGHNDGLRHILNQAFEQATQASGRVLVDGIDTQSLDDLRYGLICEIVSWFIDRQPSVEDMDAITGALHMDYLHLLCDLAARMGQACEQASQDTAEIAGFVAGCVAGEVSDGVGRTLIQSISKTAVQNILGEITGGTTIKHVGAAADLSAACLCPDPSEHPGVQTCDSRLSRKTTNVLVRELVAAW